MSFWALYYLPTWLTTAVEADSNVSRENRCCPLAATARMTLDDTHCVIRLKGLGTLQCVETQGTLHGHRTCPVHLQREQMCRLQGYRTQPFGEGVKVQPRIKEPARTGTTSRPAYPTYLPSSLLPDLGCSPARRHTNPLQGHLAPEKRCQPSTLATSLALPCPRTLMQCPQQPQQFPPHPFSSVLAVSSEGSLLGSQFLETEMCVESPGVSPAPAIVHSRCSINACQTRKHIQEQALGS